MRSPNRFLWLLSVCLLLAAPVAFAQTTGDIQGTVTDTEGKPVPGVTIEATSPSLQGTRTAVLFRVGDSGLRARVTPTISLEFDFQQ